MRAFFLIPGDLNRKTGGYGYDRRIIAEAHAIGVTLDPIELPAGFPFPNEKEQAATLAILADLPPGQALLIDGLAFGAFNAAMLQALKGPVIALVHHPLAYENGLRLQQAFQLKDSETAALAVAQRVVVTSLPTKECLVSDFGVTADRIAVAVPGTDAVAFARGSGKASPQLLGVGSLTMRKAWSVLIEALALCSDCNWALTIVGDGPDRPALEAQIDALRLNKRIRLAGEVSESDLANFYSQADLFVMPSLYEGFGMALTEAIAFGLPCIASDGVVALRHLPSQAALIVPAGDAPALADAIRSALPEQMRGLMASHARAAAPLLPRWPDAARIIVDALRSVSP